MINKSATVAVLQGRFHHHFNHCHAWRRSALWLWLLITVFLFSCGSGGGGSSAGSGTPGPGNPGNPGGTGTGPGGKGGTALSYESRFSVYNPANTERTEVAMVSIPFPEGSVSSLDKYSVKGESTCWRILQKWPDGTIRVAQAQFTVTLAAQENKDYEVVSGSTAWQGSFTRNPWVDSLWSGFSFATEVQDIDHVPYYAFLGGGGTVVTETPLAKTTRYRTYHVNPNANIGIKRDFLSLTTYVTEFQSVPVVQVDVVLGNDYLGADDPGTSTDPNMYPLGDVALKGFKVVVANNPVLFTFSSENQVGKPVDLGGGMVSYPLLHDGNRLNASTNHFLADGQVKRWRANILFMHPQGEPSQRQAVMDTWSAMADKQLNPLASLRTWRGSRAMGLHGGPVDPPSNGFARSDSEYWGWVGKNHFGPFGSWGDTQYTGTTGTPRNCPVTPEKMHIVQTGNQLLVNKLTGMAWQQACRPLHLWGLKIEPETDIYLWSGLPYTAKGGWPPSDENLGRKEIYNQNKYAHYRTGVDYGFNGPYGWNAYDNEHWTTDILFDYWSLTGDCWARDELAHMGECAMGLLRPSKYNTRWLQAVRCEGWMLASAVQIHLATGDERIKAHFQDRTHRIVDAYRKKEHASKAMGFQKDYPGTKFPTPHEFFMPWQHGPVLYGMVAAAHFWQDSVARKIAEDVVPMLEYSWVTNYQDPKYGLVKNGLRYYVPVEHNNVPVSANYFDGWSGIGVRWGDSPLGGAHTFLIAGLFYLSDMTTDRAISDKAASFGGLLLAGQLYSDEWRWQKWTGAVPDYHIPQ